MEKAGFSLTIAACFFTVFLIGWQGAEGAGADWVPGFLAVFWSLLMLLRLMTLTEPAMPHGVPETTALPGGGLAQNILLSLRKNREEDRQKILEASFGGSFLLFLCGCLCLAGWQVFCLLYPHDAAGLESVEILLRAADPGFSTTPMKIFDWGSFFMLVLAFCMMAFNLRSYASDRSMTRVLLIVLCGYAVAGTMVFAGLATGGAPTVTAVGFGGNGIGAGAYLGAKGAAATLFDAILIQSGVGGLALLAFILFVPLGYIALAAQARSVDGMVTACGLVCGGAIIASAFVPFTPYLGGFITLCSAALFLAWGASERRLTVIA